MDASIPDRAWLRAVLGRAALIGIAAGVIAVAGSDFVLAEAAGGPITASVLIATIVAAFAVGMWASAPDAGAETLPIRDRWLSAAAATAVGGAFVTSSTILQQVYPGPWWRVGGLILVIALPFYTLGLLAPIVLAWAEGWADRIGREAVPWGGIGPVAIGALGATAIGALLTGLVLLPLMTPGTLLVSVAVLLLLPNVFTDPSMAPATERELHQVVTPYGSLQVTEVVYPGERQPERRLYLNGEEESGQLVRSGAPTLPYIAAAERWLTDVTPAGASFLFLGGGAYTLPRRIAERDPRARISVVELDPEVTRLAQRFFGLRPQHRIRSVHGDARAYLEYGDREVFDRIYVDVYAGLEALPHSLVTSGAATAIARRMAPGGVAAVNLIGNVVGEERRQVWSVVKTFAESFPNVALYTHLGRDFPERQNFLLALTLGTERVFPETAGHFDRWPREEWPDADGAIVLRDLDVPAEARADTPAPTAREAF
jgi:hypothetical protein